MEDLFEKYKKYKLLQHSGIVIASLFFALGINLSLDSSQFSSYLKSNILESQSETISADLYLEKSGDTLLVKNGSLLSEVVSVNFSLSYNPENINLLNTEKNIDNYTIKIINNDLGIANIRINPKSSTSINSGTTIGQLLFLQKDDTINTLNILNANIEDSSGNIYYLRTQGIEI